MRIDIDLCQTEKIQCCVRCLKDTIVISSQISVCTKAFIGTNCRQVSSPPIFYLMLVFEILLLLTYNIHDINYISAFTLKTGDDKNIY